MTETCTLKKGFENSVPASIREVIRELVSNPTWLKICEVIYSVPMSVHVTQHTLIAEMKTYIEDNNVDYLELTENLKELHKKKYIHLEKHSSIDYYLTPITIEAIEVIHIMDKQIIDPVIKELKTEQVYEDNNETQTKHKIYSYLVAQEP
ncbi:MAG: hypothetical protein FWH37_01970 [Candidatus Bathyarchaeota archaeon]|nr:hypothetical protein [Candidatus Termiticorpusculum sp.]